LDWGIGNSIEHSIPQPPYPQSNDSIRQFPQSNYQITQLPNYQMPLLSEVTRGIADAMRQHDAARLSALRMLKAALMNREAERGYGIDDDEARQVVASLVKQRKDSIEQFQKAGRQDLVDKESAEMRVLEGYLPPAADPAVIDRAIAEAIAESGATSVKDMGSVMKAAMARLAGQRVDGRAVNELVRKKLAGA
jgi:uncharacterized protein YqeY